MRVPVGAGLPGSVPAHQGQTLARQQWWQVGNLIPVGGGVDDEEPVAPQAIVHPARCGATTKAGGACKAPRQQGTDVCVGHARQRSASTKES